MRLRGKVAGEPVVITALPRWSRRNLEDWLAFTRSDDIFGLDIEGSAEEGLGTYDPSIETRLIQFGNRTEAWVLDPADPFWRGRIERLLKDPSKRFVSHNASYDTVRVLFEFEIDLLLDERSIDTLPMAALCWPGKTKRKGLKTLCDEFIDTGLSDAERRLHAEFADLYFAQKPRKTLLLPKNFEPGVSGCRRAKCTEVSWPGSRVGYCHEHYSTRKPNSDAKSWGWSHIDLDNRPYLIYAGLDAIYVRRLLDILAEEVKRRKMSRLSKTEQRVKRLMTPISVKGLRVDAEWTKPLLDEVGAEFSDAEDTIEMIAGCSSASPKLKDWLIGRGLKVTSLDKNHLPGLVEKYGQGEISEVGEVLDALTRISARRNLLTNLRIIFRHATEGNGYIHPNINTLQAHTGRMSATDPAVQTLAKKGEKGKRLRGCLIAREGHVLIGADYDSQEVRIAAGLSRDPMLLKIVHEGLNQHVLTAESLFPDWVSKAENPDQYEASKKLDFTQQYGAFPKTIARTLTLGGIPTTEREATVLWQKWRHTYAGLVKWSDRQAAKRNVRNPFGRLIPRDPFRDYANGNYMIQSTGRDVLGAALCRLADAGWAQHFWLPIHDEFIMEVPEDLAEAGIAALTEHMSTEVEGISIPAEGELIGTRWRGLG